METRLERIRRLFTGDYGATALETKDVEWLIEQAEAADGMRAELGEAWRHIADAGKRPTFTYADAGEEQPAIIWIALSDDGANVRMWSAAGPEKIEAAGLKPIRLVLSAAANVPTLPEGVCRHCAPIVGVELASRCATEHNMIDAFNGDAPMPGRGETDGLKAARTCLSAISFHLRRGDHNDPRCVPQILDAIDRALVASDGNSAAVPARLRHVCAMLADVADEAVQGALATLAGRAIILEIVERKRNDAAVDATILATKEGRSNG